MAEKTIVKRCIARLCMLDSLCETDKAELRHEAFAVAYSMHVGERIGIINTLSMFGFLAECDGNGKWTVRKANKARRQK